jgi:hypothetical protein
MTEKDFPLSREEFIAWLRTKDENEVVGITRTVDQCPIVSFLKRLQTILEK